MEEKWIEGYEGQYSITSDGIVYSFKYGRKKALSQGLSGKNGYRIVSLCSKKGKMKIVHRLVAQAFVPNPENKPQVNHEDGNKLNNNAWNLSWTTAIENINHAINNGLINQRKEQNPSAKLSQSDISKILDIISLNQFSQAKIGAMFGVGSSTINRIKSGQTPWTIDVIGFKAIPNTRFRITDEDVIEIKKLLLANIPQKVIAAKFGISIPYICRINRGKTRQNISVQ